MTYLSRALHENAQKFGAKANGLMPVPAVQDPDHARQLGEASCSAALNYMLAGGYPPAQIVVGLPFYANGGAHYSTIPDNLKSATPQADYMEVSDGNGGWWPTASSTIMKVDAVLDPARSVLTGQATLGGVGYWEWGYENPAEPDLSQAIKTRVIGAR